MPSLAALITAGLISVSSGNTGSGSAVASGYTATLSNSSITAGKDECTVQVGAGAASTLDGKIVCT